MSVKKFLNNPKTVKTVINSLNNKVTLPSKGFLAGGSVANMLLSLYHTGSPWKFELNDVDIFIPIDPKTLKDDETSGEGECVLQPDIHLGLGLDLDECYGHVYMESDGTYYKVLNSERDGLINNVTCYIEHGGIINKVRYTPVPPENNPEKVMFPVTQLINEGINEDPDHLIIIRGFDLNCCQVGIDLSTNRIVYTKSFLNFLKSKQVLVDIPYTPFHTAIRICKKMSLYGDFCYCDINTEMNYLYQSSNLEESCQFFGVENYDKFLPYSDVISEYLTISELSLNEMPYEYRKKYFPSTIKNNDISIPKTNVPITISEERKLWTYEFKQSHESLKDIPEKFNRMWELKRIWDLRYRTIKKSYSKKIDLIMGFNDKKSTANLFDLEEEKPHSYVSKCLFTNEDYYKCDFTNEHLKEICSFINEHRRLSSLLSKHCNVQQQYNNVKMLKSLSKQEGQWIIGTLETLGQRESLKDGIITKEWVQSLIDKEKIRMSEPLCEPYDLTNFKYKDCVTELITPIDLQEEGNKMGHCVGGYSYNIETGNSRIFHIQVDGIGSTLEIGLTDFGKDENVIRIKQHHGRYPEVMGNQTPTNKNRGVAFKLIHFLCNQELDKETLNNIKKSIEDDKKTSHMRRRVIESERKLKYGSKVSSSRGNLWHNWMLDYHAGKNNPKRRQKKNNTNGIFNPQYVDMDNLGHFIF